MHVVAKQHQNEEEGEEETPQQESEGVPNEDGAKVGGSEKQQPKAIRIEDPVEFRRSMPLFFMPAKTEVEIVDLGIHTNAEKM